MKRLIASLVVCAALLGLANLPDAVAQDGKWATIKGRIIWGGDKIPERQKIAIPDANADKQVCTKDGDIYDEKWVVNPKNKGLRYTFVWLAPADPKDKTATLPIHPDLKEPKNKDVIIDQPLCQFVPHALGMRQGQVLVAKNKPPFQHNFKWTGNPNNENAGSNVLIPAGTERKIEGLVADRLPIRIECNIHPWMGGWLRVFNHPYFAITDADGNFEMAKAPVGNWRLIVWHGSGGWLGGAKGRDGQPIAVKAGDTSVGDLTYPPPAN
jgi:hypothetical protein